MTIECLQSGAGDLPRHTLRKAAVREMLTAQLKTAASDQPRWAALVFTQRQACAFVLNELLLRLPTFSRFLLAGALPPPVATFAGMPRSASSGLCTLTTLSQHAVALVVQLSGLHAPGLRARDHTPE